MGHGKNVPIGQQSGIRGQESGGQRCPGFCHKYLSILCINRVKKTPIVLLVKK